VATIHADFAKNGFAGVLPTVEAGLKTAASAARPSTSGTAMEEGTGEDSGSERFSVVTNLPYQISTAFLQTVIRDRAHIDRCVVMVQKEFAERLAATPGTKAYGSLSIFAQFFLHVRPLMDVPRTAFKPVPNVESQVVELVPRVAPLFEVADEELFFKLVRSAFWGRRKSLVKCIREAPLMKSQKQDRRRKHRRDDDGITGVQHLIKRPVRECPFFVENPMVRGDALEIHEFVQVYKELFESDPEEGAVP
jgi:16S rRNA A1518/A1519 N6-dimethyltransferase RsmA/KsgA/DIM1 with predicted DNA glycosylase/AP lyase activity